METYTFLRELADSWVLLAMTLFFVGMIAYLFRPGAREQHADAAAIPFRDEAPTPCSGGRPDCGKCKSLTEELKK